VSERVTLAHDALKMALDAPATGVGLGAFGAAYPPCQTVPLDLRFRHVESEPIEVLVEGGVPLLAVALAGAATIATLCVRVVRRRGAPWAEAGAALGVGTVLAHACCDFPLRVPGVVLPLLLILGVVLAADADLPAHRAVRLELSPESAS
jgi:O-antigen ligase